MTRYLLPRLPAAQARTRLQQIEGHLAEGRRVRELVQLDPPEAVPNPTGGQAATRHELERWRDDVVSRVIVDTPLKREHGIQFGRALKEVVDPIPSDAAHDGVWSFMSLYVFPDLVLQRWPGTGDFIRGKITLPPDRWIGAQAGRDRNYVKLCWRRWSILEPVMATADPPLGEDEFGALLERTAVARNHRLIIAAARRVVAFRSDKTGRMQFTRDLMKRICYQTGARSLDLLTDAELAQLVDAIARDLEAAPMVPAARRPEPSPATASPPAL